MNIPGKLVFIGGGNMAGAIVGGLVRGGLSPAQVVVVEPSADRRAALQREHGVACVAAPDATLAGAALAVWAVKPQVFAEAAAQAAPQVGGALQLSVMAGVRAAAIAAATGSARVVRCMPNTPALIGQGIAGVYATPEVDAAGHSLAEAVLAPTGQVVWLPREDLLDAVTALSGSGPAYVFRLIEAQLEAAQAMGLPAEDARRLAVQTVAGAAALAAASTEPVATLRRNVTSPGGTTAAALAVLEARGFGDTMRDAVLAARDRARELGGG